jgi:capsular polysaccharide biosynthesis protein
MELREYWKLLQRRWLLVLVPAAIVLIIGLATYDRPAPVYNAGVQFIVGQEPSAAADAADEQRYYTWLTSEYIVNGLTDWVRGGLFAEAVSRQLSQQGREVPAAAIQGGLAADNARSMLTISLSHGDADALAAMMEAVIVVLKEQNSAALPPLGGTEAVLAQLGDPIVNEIAPGIRSQLDLPLRVLLALAAGVGLAMLVEYLDPTIRDRDELAELGLTILGEIPKG